ncbi:MAG TPA: class I tRNA ligase family protein [Bacteroidia bacterium]|nr:class I tRNA ligase family protein [Bacteroidia bacterium]
MTDYDFKSIEKFWQNYWIEKKTYRVDIKHNKPKYYVLDMFPYPSGAGLHVGHPLGYIASDIFSRYKRLKGFNVLHPMGFDAFGLPAEQYAIQTGQHPAITTMNNIARYKEQLSKIGFSYDWDREVITCDPKYYKWTQWTFIQLFNHYFDLKLNKAESIDKLISAFETAGTSGINAASSQELTFTADQWKSFDEKKKSEILMNYRLAYQAETTVNWCQELGTVLANDEVKDGLSVRGGFPVIKKPMKQWLLRVSAYSERLLSGLENLDWSDSLKEMQRNWIGKSEGALINFRLDNPENTQIEVFTTRPDTLFGSTFMVLAPEHPIVEKITTEEYKEAVFSYIENTKKKTERDRIAETKKITGQFTGAYAIHPFSGEKLPVWIADYVLWGYGTGAIMAVPAHDSRDYAFARHFGLKIIEVVSGGNIELSAYEAKEGKMINSGFLNGLEVADAIKAMIEKIEEKGIGKGKTNYRMRDAIFSRQRYWGEPFPVYYKDGIPHVLNEDDLPLTLPEIDSFQPSSSGEPPLAKAKNWKTKDGFPLELDTMPGFAGSSGYYLRYMDPQNDDRYFSEEAVSYWKDVDLYIGGTEHATGHLIYARFWNKFLYDIGYSVVDEPFKKLVNQGMIQGRSNFVYRINHEKYAEYLLWERIKDNQLGTEFKRNYKEGHRTFDIFCEEKKIIIEIRQIKKLEKLESKYQEYARQAGYHILLIPVYMVLYQIDKVLKTIKDLIDGKEIESLLRQEPVSLKPMFVSYHIPGRELFSTELHVDVNLLENDILDIEKFRKWRPEFQEAEFILENGRYVCGWAVEKMSKSLYNVVNPDDVIEKYGADTFRMYEMFLGPIEMHKPWSTDGIEGVFKFLKKFRNLYYNSEGNFSLDSSLPDEAELKILHKTIKKIEDDINKLSFNTCVSSFMIAVNELCKRNCRKRQILEPLIILISPFAPHIAEELWKECGHCHSVTTTIWPEFNPEYLTEDSFEYPVSINGKLRHKKTFSLDAENEFIENEIRSDPVVLKWAEGKSIRKIIIVRSKIINVVIS